MEDNFVIRRESEAGPSRSIEESLAHNWRLGYKEQKHSIFLSHSGTQKPFVRRLRNALERNAYVPFFDEDSDSLPRGEPFVQHLKDAAVRADVAVVVLSDEFVTSKWPMIELEIFTEEQNRRRSVVGCREFNIFPLFMGFSVEEFRNRERRLGWLNKWQELAAIDGRINVLKWEEALGVLGGINGAKYSDFRTEEEYINNIVSTIFKLVLPDLMWEDTHVKGKLKLCQAVANMFTKAPPRTRFDNVRAIGLYGTGGLGKTTICKSLCNDYFAEFNGKVWHVELGKKGAEEIQKDVLRNLVGISESLLNQTVKSKDQWRSLLRKKIEHKVFLAIDNVWNEYICQEQAQALLGMGFHPNSLVVVTSRSREPLEWLGIHKECCFEMPELDKDDATALLLQAAAPRHDKRSMTNTQLVAIDKVVGRCFLTKGPISSSGSEKQYVPLVLEVLGRQLRIPLGGNSMKLTKWVDKLDLKWSNQKQHPVFSVLRLSYDNLPSDKHRSIFLDVALCAPRKQDSTSANVMEVCKWLGMVYHLDTDDMLVFLEDLQRDGLVERWKDLAHPFGMHELYSEFAKAEVAKEENVDEQLYLYHEDGLDVPKTMHMFPHHSYWRLRRVHSYNGGFSKLSARELQFMVHVEVLKLDFCFELVSLDLQCLKSLRSMELRGCFELQMVTGLNELKHLRFFRWNTCRLSQVAIDFPQSLEILEIYGSKASQLQAIGSWEECNNLQELTLSGHPNLDVFPNLCKLYKLEKLDFSGCCNITDQYLEGLEVLCHIKHLNLRNCKNLNCCFFLEEMVNIETLNLEGCESMLVPFVWDWTKFVRLRRFDVGGLHMVDELLFNSPQLEHLGVIGCKDLRIVVLLTNSWRCLNQLNMDYIGTTQKWTFDCRSVVGAQNSFEGLRTLNLSFKCSTFALLKNLGKIDSLLNLHLENCPQLLAMPNFGNLFLEVLSLSRCNKLEDLGDLSPLVALKEVNLKDCGALLRLQNLQSPRLKVLCLSSCYKLEDLGDLSPLVALLNVHLRDCASLLRLQNLQSPHLKVLNLSGCTKLEDLGNLSPLVALQEVNLKDCGALLRLQNLQSPRLKVLSISSCYKLEDLGDLSPLVVLLNVHLRDCASLLRLRNLQSPHLKVLRLSKCTKLEDLCDLSLLVALQEVNLSFCRALPRLQNLQSPHLKVLSLSKCNKLKDLGDLSPLVALQEVKLKDCRTLLRLQNLQSPHLKVLSLSGCNKLEDLGDLSPLLALQEVNLSFCGALLRLQNLQSPHLKVLSLLSCYKLEDLGDLSPLVALLNIHLEGCASLLRLRNLHSLKLKVLDISKCDKLEDLGDLSLLVALQEVKLKYCGALLKLQNLQSPHLKVLSLLCCDKLEDLGDLSPLVALLNVHLEGCASLLRLRNLHSLKLKVLDISKCDKLEDLGDLSPLVALQEVNLKDCRALLRLQNLQSPHLKVLSLSWCDKLEDLGDMSPLVTLQEVNLSFCGALLRLQNLQSPHLKVLKLSKCNKLKDLGDLSPLSLQEIDLEHCRPSLSLPNLHNPSVQVRIFNG